MTTLDTKQPFVAIEGLDGTGKTTQCQLLQARWPQEKFAVKTYIDPGDTPAGTEIRKLLKAKEPPLSTMSTALLFLAARRELALRIQHEKPFLAITDRWMLSTLAYQGTGPDRVPVDFLSHLGSLVVPLMPSLTIVLDIPAEIAWQRTKDRALGTADRFETDVEIYRQRAFIYEHASGLISNVVHVAGLGPVQEVSERVIQAIHEAFPQCDWILRKR